MATRRGRQGPTVRTLRAIEKILRDAGRPVTRYFIRKVMGGTISPILLEEGLAYLADQGLVYDEGIGGTVVWIKAKKKTKARMRCR